MAGKEGYFVRLLMVAEKVKKGGEMVRKKGKHVSHEKTHEKPAAKKPDMEKVWMAVSAVLLLLSVGIYGYYTGLFPSKAVKKADSYLSSFFSGRGVDYSLKSAKAVRAYELNISLNGQNTVIYETGDGKYLLQPILEIPDKVEKQEESGIPKSDRPNVKLFVMSYCPYGLQMEKAVFPVIDLLGDKMNFSINYVLYSNYGNECLGNGSYCSMHGGYELEEDIRQHCIDRLYGDEMYHKYLRDFAFNCSYENKTCWKSVVSELGLDEQKIDNCVANEETSLNWLASQRALNEQYGVRGSPTLIINGKTVSVNRSPEAVKTAICSAFNNPPEECNQTLSAESTSPGFGSQSGADASAAAACGG